MPKKIDAIMASAEWTLFVDQLTTHLTRFRRCGVFGSIEIRFREGRPYMIEARESQEIQRK